MTRMRVWVVVGLVLGAGEGWAQQSPVLVYGAPGAGAATVPVKVASDGTVAVGGAATGGGVSSCYVSSAATTNATNCKASAGQVYGIEIQNTTATLYYLRLYNLAAAPTCSSATGYVRTVAATQNSGGGGLGQVQASYPWGEAYSAGIGFCVTGGATSTDNTAAATGVLLTVLYK